MYFYVSDIEWLMRGFPVVENLVEKKLKKNAKRGLPFWQKRNLYIEEERETPFNIRNY